MIASRSSSKTRAIRDWFPFTFGLILVCLGVATVIAVDFAAYHSIRGSIDSWAISLILALLVGGFIGRIVFALVILPMMKAVDRRF